MDNIAVFGISGVGKSTLIEGFIGKNPDWAHLQAGTLIKSELKNVDHDHLRLKDNEVIIENQNLMIDAFWREIEAGEYSKIIFDGHSIIDTGSEILKIPLDVIKVLKFSKIIFINVDENIILDRRNKDQTRKRPILEEKELIVHQSIALEQAQYYSQELSLPFNVLKNPSDEDLQDAIILSW